MKPRKRKRVEQLPYMYKDESINGWVGCGADEAMLLKERLFIVEKFSIHKIRAQFAKRPERKPYERKGTTNGHE